MQVYGKLSDLPRILLIDNYDSFTYNLFHYLEELGADINVEKNDTVNPDQINAYDAVLLSPGPGLPSEAGKLMEVIEKCKGDIPVFGVCLGMQAIAISLGGQIYNQELVKHGVQEVINLSESVLFQGLGKRVEVGLYHSWAVRPEPGDIEITALSDTGVVMALQNQSLKMYGVQFHPESIMTPDGKVILRNFLENCLR